MVGCSLVLSFKVAFLSHNFASGLSVWTWILPNTYSVSTKLTLPSINIEKAIRALIKQIKQGLEAERGPEKISYQKNKQTLNKTKKYEQNTQVHGWRKAYNAFSELKPSIHFIQFVHPSFAMLYQNSVKPGWPQTVEMYGCYEKDHFFYNNFIKPLVCFDLLVTNHSKQNSTVNMSPS